MARANSMSVGFAKSKGSATGTLPCHFTIAINGNFASRIFAALPPPRERALLFGANVNPIRATNLEIQGTTTLFSKFFILS